MSSDNLKKVAAVAVTSGVLLSTSYFLIKTQSNNLALDLQFLRKIISPALMLKLNEGKEKYGFVDHWAECAKKYSNKTCLKFIFDNDSTITYTYKQVDELSNQVANALHLNGLKYGDAVALMMENRPEFIITWVGVVKAGGICALINTHLSGKPLLHSFVAARVNRFIIGAEHLDVVMAVRNMIQNSEEHASIKNGQYFVVGREAEGFKCLDHIVKDQPHYLLATVDPPRKPDDPLLYIYTSGTTGLPKAGVISNMRGFFPASLFYHFFDLRPDDIYYCCLPLYHSAATLIALSVAWYGGLTFVFRRKFSASKFWMDCAAHECTVSQYIGELCHYLMERPGSPEDKAHKVRLIIGNGLRMSIWEKFQSRFNIQKIGEFYGATEGTTVLFNYPGKVGAIGYVPKIMLKTTVPISIIKYDVENEEIVRGPDGFCIKCAFNEPGQLVAKLRNEPGLNFKGYTSKEATSKKILRDVFVKGDEYFMTGDLLKVDSEGFYYFVDRIGDTYRWKGENVATGEVEAVIKEFEGIKEVNVYGVSMPFTSGRAGMAYIVVDESFDLEKFYRHTYERLPSYASPLFLRLGKEVEVTGTMKHIKAQRRAEGFDPSVIAEPLFFRDTKLKKFIPLTRDVFERIMKEKHDDTTTTTPPLLPPPAKL